MIELLMTADDFTGALDSGVQLSKQGCMARVLSEGRQEFVTEQLCRKDAGSTEPVLVIDTQSRHLSKEDAASRVARHMAAAAKAGVPVLYKKTDSTLRGNVGAELEGALLASGREKLVFVPAYPRLGRTVAGGIVRLNGELLERTDVAKDPFTPVCSSDLRQILSSQTRLEIECVNVAELAAALTKPGRRILCVDGTCDGDLERAAEILSPWRDKVVFAGCAGFAEHLPGMLSVHSTAREEYSHATSMLLVCGSVNGVSLEQMDCAEQNGISSILVQDDVLLDGDYLSSPKGQEFCARVADTLRTQKLLILRTARSREDVNRVRQEAYRRGMDEKKLHLQIADNLSGFAAAVTVRFFPDVLAVFGGDTLAALVARLGGGGISPQFEVLPGTVLSTMNIHGKPCMILSKSGSFGERDAVLQLQKRLMSHEII